MGPLPGLEPFIEKLNAAVTQCTGDSPRVVTGIGEIAGDYYHKSKARGTTLVVYPPSPNPFIASHDKSYENHAMEHSSSSSSVPSRRSPLREQSVSPPPLPSPVLANLPEWANDWKRSPVTKHDLDQLVEFG